MQKQFVFAFTLLAGWMPIHARADEAKSQAREGVKAYEKQDYEAAIKSFRRAAELKPEALDYQFNLGTALARRDQYDEAELALRKAAEAEKELPPDAAYNLAYAIAQGASSEESKIQPQEKVSKKNNKIGGTKTYGVSQVFLA